MRRFTGHFLNCLIVTGTCRTCTRLYLIQYSVASKIRWVTDNHDLTKVNNHVGGHFLKKDAFGFLGKKYLTGVGWGILRNVYSQ